MYLVSICIARVDVPPPPPPPPPRPPLRIAPCTVKLAAYSQEVHVPKFGLLLSANCRLHWGRVLSLHALTSIGVAGCSTAGNAIVRKSAYKICTAASRLLLTTVPTPQSPSPPITFWLRHWLMPHSSACEHTAVVPLHHKGLPIHPVVWPSIVVR